MMTAIVFNGTKIYMDTDMELHVIRGDLHIDTKAFKAEPKARSVSKRGAKVGTVSVAKQIRESLTKVGKSVTVQSKYNTIWSALRTAGFSATISSTGKDGVFEVTRTA